MATQAINPSAAQLSCTSCRSKKLKCDRAKPQCSRCVKLVDQCVYPKSRQKRVGKRRQVSELEARLAQVENILNRSKTNKHYKAHHNHETTNTVAYHAHSTIANTGQCSVEGNASITQTSATNNALFQLSESTTSSLLNDPPSIQLMEELTAVYFDKLHHESPMLHRSRYMETLRSPPDARSPICLRYILMALAASTTEKHRELALLLYQRARADAESRRKMDDNDQVLAPDLAVAPDFVEIEERRRTWWVIFISDRFICATTGWPAQIDERDVRTFLPSSDEAFERGIEEPTSLLQSVLSGKQHNYSALAGRVLAAYLFCSTLQHVLRSASEDNNTADAQNTPYWARHSRLDNDLVIMLMSLPNSLKLPGNFKSLNAIFVSITIHTAIIFLQRAALWKCQQLTLPTFSIHRYKMRLVPAAHEIVNFMRLITDMDAALMNPLMALSAYTAASVFLDDITTEKNDESEASLDLLLHILVKVGISNPVAGSLAIQLAAEIRKRRGISLSIMQKVQ
ncbi:binuclear zinc transcription factor [Trichoderma arundinaceum]|uniref:Binuclear zinc transcription factor n=1 Tax=Trichoderma arundinaceum TaxID=490622 RepID=A0A395NV71_TRIAR|nr:binuclear zinc transcription factor [Trichoderma arundinaceum]